jgi:hypothetical protein
MFQNIDMVLSREELAALAAKLKGKYSRARYRQRFINELLEARKRGVISKSTFSEYQQYLKATDEYAKQRAVLALDEDKQSGRAPDVPAELVEKAKEQAFPGYKAKQTAPVQQLTSQEDVKPLTLRQDQASQDPYSVVIQPWSKINKDNIAEQIATRRAFMPLAGLANATGRTVTVTYPPRRVVNIQEETKIFGFTVSKRTRQRVQYLEPRSKPQGTYTEFLPERDLITPSFLGMKEPGFTALRTAEYKIKTAADVQDIKYIRSGYKDRSSYLKATAYNALATPLSIINRPIKSVVAAGTFVLTKNVLSAGGPVTAGQAALALGAEGTAISLQQEVKQGGTGTRTLGQLTFFVGAAATVYGAGKLKSALFDKTDITYKVFSKGKEAKDFTGVTQQGSVLNNKKYIEAFTTKGETTFRTIQYKGQTMKIIERPTFQAIKIFKNNKLVGEDFKYIDPGSSIRGSILSHVTGRQTLLYDQSTLSRSSKLTVLETRGGTYSKELQQGRTTTKIDLKLSETFRRNIVATDQVIKISGKNFRSVDFVKPEISFGKNASYPHDQVIIEKVGIGKGASWQRVDIIAPRVMEKSVFAGRYITGTVNVKKDPMLSQISLGGGHGFKFGIGKRGSVSTSAVLDLVPKISIGPKTSSDLSFMLPSMGIMSQGPSSAFVPIFSFDSGTLTATKTKKAQSVRPAISLGSGVKLSQTPVPSTRPEIVVGTSVKPVPVTIQDVDLRQDTKLRLVQSPLNVQSPGAHIIGPPGFNFRQPSSPGGPGLPGIPKLPKFNLNMFDAGPRKRSNGISEKNLYRPSLEALAFNVRGSIKTGEISPFELRPMRKKKKRKR